MDKPLTDAELNALGKDANWDSRYGERAIAELLALRAAAPLCEKHKPNGGTRSNCLVCALIENAYALSRIDYICGEPNEYEVSGYDVHCDQGVVVLRVEKLREQNAALDAGMGEFRRELRNALFPFWPNNMGVGGDEIVDAVRRAVEQNTKLEARLKGYQVVAETLAQQVNEMGAQNAKLVGALERISKHYPTISTSWDGLTRPRISNAAQEQREIAIAALASVKGEQG